MIQESTDFTTVNIGEYDFVSNKDGSWDWVLKAKRVTPLKKDGSLKAQYKDLPRYDVIYEWEDEVKQNYNKELKENLKEITKKLRDFSKK